MAVSIRAMSEVDKRRSSTIGCRLLSGQDLCACRGCSYGVIPVECAWLLQEHGLVTSGDMTCL